MKNNPQTLKRAYKISRELAYRAEERLQRGHLAEECFDLLVADNAFGVFEETSGKWARFIERNARLLERADGLRGITKLTAH